MSIEDIKQIVDTHKIELLNKANVKGVAVGYKYTNGVRTDEIVLIANVSQKIPIGELNPSDIVPPQIDGINTDVIETGSIQVHYDPTQRFRPAPGGVSIGHKDVTAGTLGVVVVPELESSPSENDSYASMLGMVTWPIDWAEKSSELYILSNNHVLANCNYANIGDPIYQPGPYDGGTAADTIATLHSFVPIKFGSETNLVDCALAKPINISDVIPKEILEIGEVSGTVEAELGMPVRKYGRTTQYLEGIVTQIYATVIVGGYNDGDAIFEEQILTTLMSDGGDSGSLLVECDGQRAVGLLFAGSSTITVHNRIANVESGLGIKL